ncbi:hypothetical protein FRB99_003661 [Tulasnella sp. 403]|nr:hypothetical protein FRB99_003661 [Tulasnella sp. 403]
MKQILDVLLDMTSESTAIEERKKFDFHLLGILQVLTDIKGLKFSLDQRWVAVSGRGYLSLYEVKTVEFKRRIVDYSSDAFCFTPDGKALVFANINDILVGMFPATRERTNAVPAEDVAADGNFIASGSGDGTVRLWYPKDDALNTVLSFPHADLAKTHESTTYPLCVAVSSDCQTVAAGGSHLRVQVWNSITFSGDSRWLVSGADDKRVICWDLATLSVDEEGRQSLQAEHKIFERHGTSLKDVAVARSGNGILSGTSNGKIYFSDVGSGSTYEIASLVDPVPITGVLYTISENMDGYVARGYDSVLKIWSVVRLYEIQKGGSF